MSFRGFFVQGIGKKLRLSQCREEAVHFSVQRVQLQLSQCMEEAMHFEVQRIRLQLSQ